MVGMWISHEQFFSHAFLCVMEWNGSSSLIETLGTIETNAFTGRVMGWDFFEASGQVVHTML